MTIAAHCLVKNEERFLWYAVMSIVDYVDEVFLWDTGSTDNTKKIISEIKNVKGGKIKTRFIEGITPESFPEVRQQMLDETKTDWFFVVDGDEIWWEDGISQVVSVIQDEGSKLESIVTPTINLIGDMYHKQEEGAGQYRLAGRKGHLSMRAINRSISGLSSSNPHGTWGWVDGEGKMIQNRSADKVKFVDFPYLHTSFLRRSGKDEGVMKRKKKLKYEIGDRLPKDFYYPEVFFRPRSLVVPNVWESMSGGFKRRAMLQTPLRKLKRRIMPAGVGY